MTTEPRRKGEQDDTVAIDRRVVIEILKTLEGIKRVLHTLLKK